MSKRRAALAASFVAVSLALAGCGDSVSAGGENAATHPASGIWVARTVGGENISEPYPTPTAPFQLPANIAPKTLPPGLSATEAAVQSAVTGGCWEDAHEGNLYGAYDQLFWWQGQCGDTIDEVTVELYATVTAATAQVHHATSNALLDRYQDGAVIVDVYDNAPLSVLSQLAAIKGLRTVPGYGG
jgi:predicted small secreted protein